jgi:hypothetical protein
MAIKKLMVKPGGGTQNFNIDQSLASKTVEIRGETVKVYGDAADLEKKYPSPENIGVLVNGQSLVPDLGAESPVLPENPGELLPISIVGGAKAVLESASSVVTGVFDSAKDFAANLAGLDLQKIDELAKLAALQALILEAKQELGDIPKGTPPTPQPVKRKNYRISNGKLVAFNVDKTQPYRDVVERLPVTTYDDNDNATTEFKEIEVRVYGTEAELAARYGARNSLEGFI